jgi:hypothetical protein
MGSLIKASARGNPTFYLAIACIVVGLGISLSGCNRSETPIWSAEAKSPDAHWMASATTIENGGFGTGDVETSVYLTNISQSKPSIQILGFVNQNARPIGVTSVKMNWVTPSHLNVIYKDGAKLGFQLVKYADIDITVHKLDE